MIIDNYFHTWTARQKNNMFMVDSTTDETDTKRTMLVNKIKVKTHLWPHACVLRCIFSRCEHISVAEISMHFHNSVSGSKLELGKLIHLTMVSCVICMSSCQKWNVTTLFGERLRNYNIIVFLRVMRKLRKLFRDTVSKLLGRIDTGCNCLRLL